MLCSRQQIRNTGDYRKHARTTAAAKRTLEYFLRVAPFDAGNFERRMTEGTAQDVQEFQMHNIDILTTLLHEYVVAGFSPRAAMRNSKIHQDRTPAKAGDYIPDFTCGGFYVQSPYAVALFVSKMASAGRVCSPATLRLNKNKPRITRMVQIQSV